MATTAGGSRSAARRVARRLAHLRDDALRPLRLRARALVARPGPATETHLSWSEDPKRTLTVSWLTPTRRNEAEVLYRRADGGPVGRVSGSSRSLPGTARWLHRAVVRGLEPGTAYEYRVSSDRGVEPSHSGWKRARTAPTSRSDPFRVVFLCDTGVGGRSDGTTRETEAVLRAISADPPLCFLGGGDYAYVRRDERFRDPGEGIDRWFASISRLSADAPFMAQYGNHEVGLDERVGEWAARFAHPSGTRDGLSYAFDLGAAHFVGLFAPGRAPPPEHLKWLERDLSGPVARAASWRIVFQHAPPFASGSSHPARPEVRALAPLFERLGVDLHLSGHDQSYERTHPLGAAGIEPPATDAEGRATYPAGRGVVYAKVSPAGKLSERGRDFSRFGAAAGPEIASRDDHAHHWAIVTISDRELSVEVMGLTGDAPARTLDRFALLGPAVA